MLPPALTDLQFFLGFRKNNKKAEAMQIKIIKVAGENDLCNRYP